MPNTDARRVREDYWYTSAQIVDVGYAWQLESPERLFIFLQRRFRQYRFCSIPCAALGGLAQKYFCL